MFYNPPCLYDESGEWRTPEQKSFSKRFAAMKLSRALTDASHRKHQTQWVVHSDGVHLLKLALEALGGTDLSNHTVRFTAPTKDISVVIPDLNRANMQLHDEVMKIQDSDWRSKRAQMWRFQRLKRELSKIPGFEDQAQILATQGSKDLRTYFGYLGTAALAGTLLSPTTPALGSIATATIGALAIWDKAQNLRNIGANNLDAPGLNPHFHPFDTNDQMNHRARKYSGGSLKTFADVLKLKLRR